MSMIVSTKLGEHQVIEQFDLRIIYDDPEELYIVNTLAKEFETSLSTNPLISAALETESMEQFVVLVDHVSESFLLNLDDRKLEFLKSMFAQAKGILWITFGGYRNGKSAGAGAVSGLLRTLRSENDGMRYVTCDVDSGDFSKPETTRAISKVFVASFSESGVNPSVRDFEYAVRDGRISIPRIVEDKIANKAIMAQASNAELEEQPLWQEGSCLCLDMGHIGLLDTFHFIHSEKTSAELPHDEVEIEVKTVGLNFHDLMVATGQLPDPNGFGTECAGIVTKVGKTACDVEVGDKVLAIAPSAFASHVRTSHIFASKMPDSMTFETGASISNVFTTAYYCVQHAARLQKYESILIHSAAGGIGQACIKIAQLIGAKIYVTAGSPAKVAFLEKHFGLPRNHILNSRTLDFGHQLMSLTEGKGVDVIINSLAGDALRESWRCLAMFGRFIELGKKDAVENSRLDMAPFEKSASFISVGWDHFATHRPAFFGRVFKEVMELFANGCLNSVEPITAFSMSDIESAFRFMASGNHMGKIVVNADKDCLVKVRRTPRRLFRC